MVIGLGYLLVSFLIRLFLFCNLFWGIRLSGLLQVESFWWQRSIENREVTTVLRRFRLCGLKNNLGKIWVKLVPVPNFNTFLLSFLYYLNILIIKNLIFFLLKLIIRQKVFSLPKYLFPMKFSELFLLPKKIDLFSKYLLSFLKVKINFSFIFVVKLKGVPRLLNFPLKNSFFEICFRFLLLFLFLFVDLRDQIGFLVDRRR